MDGQMDKLIVGSDDCSFRDICSCLSKATTAGLLYRQWKELAKTLKLPSPKIVSIDKRLSSGVVTNLEGLLEILECWRAVKTSDARLGEFILALEKLQLVDLADLLRQKFTSPNWIPSPQNENLNVLFIRRVGEITYDTSKKISGELQGFVYKGKIRQLDVAVKKMVWSCEDELKKQIQEAEIMGQLRGHPNIEKFYKIETDQDFFYMAFELCDGTLEQWLNEEIQSIPRSAISSIVLLQQATKGLEYLYNNKIVHRNLNPRSILLVRTANRVVAKITGFIIREFFPPHQGDMTATSYYGTIGWEAPETLKAKYAEKTPVGKMSTATDIFSLGCIFYYVLMNMKHPFGDDEDEREFNIKYNRIQTAMHDTSSLSTETLDLITRMIAEQPSQRPTINEILKNSFQYFA